MRKRHKYAVLEIGVEEPFSVETEIKNKSNLPRFSEPPNNQVIS